MSMNPGRDIDAMRAAYSAGDAFAAQLVGARIDSCGPGSAVCSLEIGPQHKNGHGIVMGGVMFTLADFAFAVACDAMRTQTVTLSSSIQFLSAARANRLIAQAVCLRDGRSVCFYSVDVRDENGNAIASVSITGKHTV